MTKRVYDHGVSESDHPTTENPMRPVNAGQVKCPVCRTNGNPDKHTPGDPECLEARDERNWSVNEW